jgi:hypothetical protein
MLGGVNKPHRRRPPRWLYWLELSYLIALFLVFVVYEESGWFRGHLPVRFGQVSAATVWFGAVGAVLISLTGIFKHSTSWDGRFEEWHIARPLLGAVIGPMGCLLLVVLVDTASKDTASTNPAFYDAAAFLVGYREETFRLLIKRGTDVMLGSRPGKDLDSAESEPDHDDS